VREQAIVQKVGNRSGMTTGRRSNSAQKPVRRERGNSNASLIERMRSFAGYASVLLKLVLVVAAIALLFTGYRAAASASFFEIRKVEVQGISRGSRDDVQTVVRREVSSTGVWRADLKSLSAKLEQLPWIRSAIVSRVLPDGLRVRIVERAPRAVVRTASGRFRWVDDEAVLLGEMGSVDQMPSFFMRGLNEDDSEGARTDNIERVRQFLKLQGESEAAGVSERISEVNFSDLRDVRAQLAGDDSEIELRLGSKDFGSRLKKGLEVLDAQRSTSMGPFITYIIMDQKIPIVGHSSAARRVKKEAGRGDETVTANFEVDKKPRPKKNENRRER
jgi:cell division protein FtsQ